MNKKTMMFSANATDFIKMLKKYENVLEKIRNIWYIYVAIRNAYIRYKVTLLKT